ncbi:hypothetical protein ABZ023_18510 [Streptomyces sp. NPDC006367]|uniref:hypothetical protein n=1 Tax=unclassified Streptomyces TaxID=2593676 RepID=UPI0033A793E9
MTILLLGRWDHGGNLTIEESHTVADEDQAAVDRHVNGQDDTDGMAWAATFYLDTHRQAIQDAYEEYVRDEGGRLIDNVHGIQPDD